MLIILAAFPQFFYKIYRFMEDLQKILLYKFYLILGFL